MIAIFVIGVNLLIGVFLMTRGNLDILPSITLFVSMQLAGAFYAYIAQSEKVLPISFILFVFYCYGFIMPGLYQTRTGDFFWRNTIMSSAYTEKAAFLVLTTLMAFFMGYLTRLQVPGAFLRRRIIAARLVEKPNLVMGDRSLFITLVFSFLTLVFVLGILALLGPGVFFGTRAAISDSLASSGINSSLRGLTRTLSQATSLSMLAVVLFLMFRLKIRSNSLKISFAFAAIATFIANFPLSVPRYWLVATLFVIALTAFYDTFVKWRRLIILSTPAILFLIFPTLGSFNRRGDSIQFDLNLVSPLNYMGHGDFDGFQSIVNVLNLVQTEGLSFGGQLLSVFLFFVPRSIWHGKHFSVGSEAAEAAGYQFTIISMPLPGELYANWGWLGALAGMFLFGTLVRRLDATFMRVTASLDHPTIAIGAVLTGAFMPILFRGSLLGTFGGYASAIGLVWLCFTLPRIRIFGQN